MIPTSLNALVADSIVRVERIRKQYNNPEDFDHVVRRMLRELLTDMGYDKSTVKFTMRAIFGD